MAKIEHRDIIFDSKEEIVFYEWLLEAKEMGFIKGFTYHTDTYILVPKTTYTKEVALKTKTKVVEKTRLQEYTYTPDFVVDFTQKFYDKFPDSFPKRLPTEPLRVTVDIKGRASKYDADRRFSINQKLMFQIYHVFVHKVVLKDFFINTWAPVYCAFQAKHRNHRSSTYISCKLSSEV